MPASIRTSTAEAAVVRKVVSASRRRSDGEITRRRVLDAAVESILASGYYQTSSNEIARRAGVTWGVIQHQFGTRDALLLEVLNDSWAKLQESMAHTEVCGATLEERLHVVLGALTSHYGEREYLALIQILIDLTRNPKASEDVRKAAAVHGAKLSRAWKPCFQSALGDAAGEEDLVRYAFTTLRGYLTGQVISSRVRGERDDPFQRELLVRGVAAAVRAEAAVRGIELA